MRDRARFLGAIHSCTPFGFASRVYYDQMKNYLRMTPAPRCFSALVRCVSVRRRDGVRRESRPRWLPGTRGGAGLASTVGPVLVGVIFAFAWNIVGSHVPEMPQVDPGLAPTVGTAVDQAADQAWASATPITTRPPDRRTPDPAGSRGPARTGCYRARSSRVVRAVPAVDSAKVPACSSPRRFPEARKTTSAMSASTTALSAHRRPGHFSTLIVVVPTRGNQR